MAPFKAAGQVVMCISFQEGVISAIPGFERIRSMKSFVSLEENVTVGEKLEKTVDLFGVTGMCVLAHSDTDTLKADVAAIRAMETDGSLFALEEDSKVVGEVA